MADRGGPSIPRLGLGTDGRTGEDGLRAILAAIELGYRHLDTAQTYDTETNVGRAIAASALPRRDFFVVTKIANFNLARDKFRASLAASLDRLQLDHLDLLLIHWPSAGDTVPLAEYVDELANAKAGGLTRYIGVSNFTIAHLEKTIARLGDGEIATNQVELHPYLQQRRLRAYCGARGIPLTAYLPIARGRVADDAVMRAIGDRHGVAATTIALAWSLQSGAMAIPASSQSNHLSANLAAARVRLTANDMAEIAQLDRGLRLIDPPGLSPAWD